MHAICKVDNTGGWVTACFLKSPAYFSLSLLMLAMPWTWQSVFSLVVPNHPLTILLFLTRFQLDNYNRHSIILHVVNISQFLSKVRLFFLPSSTPEGLIPVLQYASSSFPHILFASVLLRCYLRMQKSEDNLISLSSRWLLEFIVIVVEWCLHN